MKPTCLSGAVQHRHILSAFTVCCFLLTAGCNTTDSIVGFTLAADKTLAAGTPVFEDFSETCVREVSDKDQPGIFPLAHNRPPECQAIADKVKGLEEASVVVSTYFEVMNSLASFNTAKTGADVEQLASNAGELAGLSAPRRDALASVAQIITQIATSSYQAKHLREDVVKANPHIQVVMGALQESIGGPGMYLTMLDKEEGALASRSREFLLTNPSSPESTLLLDRQWQTDRRTLAMKRNSAQSFIQALGLIAKGHDDLAKHASNIKARELLAILSPYVEQLPPLISNIQKAF